MPYYAYDKNGLITPRPNILDVLRAKKKRYVQIPANALLQHKTIEKMAFLLTKPNSVERPVLEVIENYIVSKNINEKFCCTDQNYTLHSLHNEDSEIREIKAKLEQMSLKYKHLNDELSKPNFRQNRNLFVGSGSDHNSSFVEQTKLERYIREAEIELAEIEKNKGQGLEGQMADLVKSIKQNRGNNNFDRLDGKHLLEEMIDPPVSRIASPRMMGSSRPCRCQRH